MSRQTRVLLLAFAAGFFTVLLNIFDCVYSDLDLTLLNILWPSLTYPLPAVLSGRYRRWRRSLEYWLDEDVLPRLRSDLERLGLPAPTYALACIRERMVERQLERCAPSAVLWEVIDPRDR